MSALSIALLGGSAVFITAVALDAAWAGNGNGGGGGNGGGNGNGGNNASSDNDKGNNGAKASRSAKTKLKASRSSGKNKAERKAALVSAPETTPSTGSGRAKGNRIAQELGVHPSELGALNAANASWTALENASPNSRVGMIKIYADAVLVTQETASALADAVEILESLDAPTRDLALVESDIMNAESMKMDLEGQLADLDAAFGEADEAEIEGLMGEIDAVKAAISDLDSDIEALNAELADGQAFQDAEDDVARLEDEMATQSADQRAALEAAANKEVTDEVEIAVQTLLGIYEDPIVEEEEIEESRLD